MESNNICSICLHNDYSLIQSKEVDSSNVSWSEKLRTFIPEIEWEDDYYLCKPCLNQVEIATLIRNLCLHNQSIRLTYVKNEEHPSTEEQKGDNDNIFASRDLKPTSNDVLDWNSESVAYEESMKLSDFSDEEKDSSDDKDWPPIPSSQKKKQGGKGKKQFSEKKSPPKQSRVKYNSFDCDICNTNFTNVKEFTEHSTTVHNLDGKTLRPYKCTQCDHRFTESYHLLRHTRAHDKKRMHICPYCGKGYIHRCDLILHEKEHLNKREYQCDSCPKNFNTYPHLRSHKIVVHTDRSTWKFVCPYCERRFPIKANYDRHVRRHTGEKNFTCHLCEKQFSENAYLQRHLVSHSNVRAHKCDHCPKEFKLNKVLRMHMAKVHGIGPYKVPVVVKKHECTVCGKKFSAKDKLSRHMCTHTGEKPFSCPMCEKRFTDKSYVTQHLKTVHTIITQDGEYKDYKYDGVN